MSTPAPAPPAPTYVDCKACGDPHPSDLPCMNPECLISPVPTETPLAPHWEKLAEARARLHDHGSYLAHGVADLRMPEITKKVPTAGVGVDPKSGAMRYYWNPDFLDKLDFDETAFVSAHESYHVLNGHIGAMADLEYPDLYNICADVLINTQLQEEARLPISPRLKKILWDADKIKWGNKYQLLQYASAEDLYDELKKDADKVKQILKQAAEMIMNGDLQCDNGNGDQTQETLDNHGGLGSIEQAAADQLLRELDESGALSRAKAAGNVPANILRRYERINQSFAWKKHMQRMLASIVKRYQAWDRPHRLNEIMHGIGGLVRPGELIRNDYNCLVYADASGSIGPEEVGRFVDVLIRAPKEIKMHVFSFDTQIYEWPDWKKAGDIPGGGGTYFGAIVEHADDKEARGFTPDAVIVLTDGWAEDPTPREPRRWLWISTDQLLSRQSGTWVKMPPQGAKPSQKRRLR